MTFVMDTMERQEPGLWEQQWVKVVWTENGAIDRRNVYSHGAIGNCPDPPRDVRDVILPRTTASLGRVSPVMFDRECGF